MRQEGRRAGYCADAVLEHAGYTDSDAHYPGYPGQRSLRHQHRTHDAGRHVWHHRYDGHHPVILGVKNGRAAMRCATK